MTTKMTNFFWGSHCWHHQREKKQHCDTLIPRESCEYFQSFYHTYESHGLRAKTLQRWRDPSIHLGLEPHPCTPFSEGQRVPTASPTPRKTPQHGPHSVTPAPYGKDRYRVPN